MNLPRSHRVIFGTPIFDGASAQRGYALNRMCYSLNHADNRASLVRDAEDYCRRFGLSDQQLDAVRKKDVLALIAAGGNIYYLAKLAGTYGLNVQDIGAQQTGMSVGAFKEKLRAAGDH